MAKNILLSRTSFRENTLDRDGHKCVICGRTVTPDGKVKLDAHHIMERALWTAPQQFGGYFLDNGATLCDTGYDKLDGRWSCHLQAGMTLLSPEEVRAAAGIKTILLPEHLYPDQKYTVWGDPLMPNGLRMKGELFEDESVQLMLKMGDALRLYTKYVRHPRTYHLPYSPIILAGKKGDDEVMRSTEHFEGKRVIVTAKMDGMQTTVYSDYMHGRTPDFKSDPTWHWLQNFTMSFRHEIPDGYRLNLENLWGSMGTDIQYAHLPQYAMAFMMWNDKNMCLPWNELVEWVSLFDDIAKTGGFDRGLPLVPVIYDGVYDEEAIKELHKPELNGDPMEGFVVRLADSFHYSETRKWVGKYVRAEHRVRHGGELRRNDLL